MPSSEQSQQKTAKLYHGFHDSIHDPQQVFRQLLKAMSEPGTLQYIDHWEKDSALADNGFYQTSYATALSLLDGNCKVGLSAQLDHALTRNSLSFHSACSLVKLNNITNNATAASELDFLFLNAQEWQTLSTNTGLSLGDLSYPDKSTTVIVQVAAIRQTLTSNNKDEVMKLLLSGPGIEHQRTIFIEGLTAALLNSLQQNQTLFPLGYDFIITAPDVLMALPRTCQIELITSDNKLRSGD